MEGRRELIRACWLRQEFYSCLFLFFFFVLTKVQTGNVNSRRSGTIKYTFGKEIKEKADRTDKSTLNNSGKPEPSFTLKVTFVLNLHSILNHLFVAMVQRISSISKCL